MSCSPSRSEQAGADRWSSTPPKRDRAHAAVPISSRCPDAFTWTLCPRIETYVQAGLIGDTASMQFRRAVRVLGLVVAMMATGCTANSPAPARGRSTKTLRDGRLRYLQGGRSCPLRRRRATHPRSGHRSRMWSCQRLRSIPDFRSRPAVSFCHLTVSHSSSRRMKTRRMFRSLLNPNQRRRCPWRTSSREVPQAEGRRSRSCGSR